MRVHYVTATCATHLHMLSDVCTLNAANTYVFSHAA
jgi:hypothetical protein